VSRCHGDARRRPIPPGARPCEETKKNIKACQLPKVSYPSIHPLIPREGPAWGREIQATKLPLAGLVPGRRRVANPTATPPYRVIATGSRSRPNKLPRCRASLSHSPAERGGEEEEPSQILSPQAAHSSCRPLSPEAVSCVLCSTWRSRRRRPSSPLPSPRARR
jgi:hypothetical protein